MLAYLEPSSPLILVMLFISYPSPLSSSSQHGTTILYQALNSLYIWLNDVSIRSYALRAWISVALSQLTTLLWKLSPSRKG